METTNLQYLIEKAKVKSHERKLKLEEKATARAYEVQEWPIWKVFSKPELVEQVRNLLDQRPWGEVSHDWI